MDGRQPHVRSPAAPGAPGAGLLQSGFRAESDRLGIDAGQRFIGRPQHGGQFPLAPGRGAHLVRRVHVGQKVHVELRRPGLAEVHQEILEEVRQDVGEEIGEEVRREVGKEIREEGHEEDVHAAPGQEEGFRARSGEPRRALDAEAAGQEARASLTR